MGKTPKKKTSSAVKPKAKKSTQSVKSQVRQSQSRKDLLMEIGDLHLRLDEAMETLNAIRSGEVDAMVVSGPKGEQVYMLKGAEQPYRILVESMNEGALSLMEDSTIISCNRAFSDMAGITGGMLIGRSFKEFVAGEDADKYNVFWKQAKDCETRAELGLSFSGRAVPALISACARIIEGESRIFLVVTDISERKKTEAELTRYREHLEEIVAEQTKELRRRTGELDALNKELEAFVYSVSHDLRAPLRVMEGFAKIVTETYADKLDAEGKNYLARIRFSSEQMSHLIEDLLRLSRISRQAIRTMRCDLSSIASSVMRGLCQADPARNIEVVIEEGISADVDLDLMKIAISNLLSNAWKFTSTAEKASIEFGRVNQEGKAVYFVRDNGVGFDQTYANKMFLPFQRLHAEKEFEGTGIGLSIVERIIRRHGGRIWAEGEVGKGATVYFTLD